MEEIKHKKKKDIIVPEEKSIIKKSEIKKECKTNDKLLRNIKLNLEILLSKKLREEDSFYNNILQKIKIYLPDIKINKTDSNIEKQICNENEISNEIINCSIKNESIKNDSKTIEINKDKLHNNIMKILLPYLSSISLNNIIEEKNAYNFCGLIFCYKEPNCDFFDDLDNFCSHKCKAKHENIYKQSLINNVSSNLQDYYYVNLFCHLMYILEEFEECKTILGALLEIKGDSNIEDDMIKYLLKILMN